MKNVELPFIRGMFDAIAPRYDLLNRLLSLRQDVWWRRAMIAAMEIPKNGCVLDVACGTGDVMLEILRQKGAGVRVVGADFSPGMLLLAKEKMGASEGCLVSGNALRLPFRKNVFDAVTIAFGIRNIVDKHAAMKAFHDCLKPGGMLLILELATPEKGPLRTLYLSYFERLLPLIGWFFSKNLSAYQYLPQSVVRFPKPADFAAIMRSAGFSDIRWRNLTLGIATLYVGIRR